MSEIKITKDNFEKEVLNSSEPVLVDFWATWCGPCKMLSPIIEEISNEAHGFKVAKINIDEEKVLAAQYGVNSIPTLIMFKNGKEANRSVGFIPKDEVLKFATK